MADRPGFMVYFTDWLPLLKLDDATLAALLRACVNYASAGEWPELEGMSSILWGMLHPKIDRDGERYESRKESGKYAAYCRDEKRAGREPASFEDWKSEKDRSITNDNGFIQQQPQPQQHLQSQSHFQSHSQPQSQGQRERQGDARGAGRETLFRPLTESEFEAQRQKQLEMLARSGL